MLITGQIISNNEAGPILTLTLNNIVRELVSAGKTWKSYAESLPAVGYTGLTSTLNYVQHHKFAFLF